MNMKDKDIDQLTRRLMKGTAERPPASLNARIMASIRRQQAPKVFFVPNMPSVASGLGWFLAYIALAVGIFYYMYEEKLTMSAILEGIAPYMPMVLTLALAVPLYAAGVWWDWKRNKEERRQEESLRQGG